MVCVEQKGLIIVHTGDGKGKTTAALGLAVRAWGDGLRVLILQFIKGGWKYGELDTMEKLKAIDGRIELRQCGKGFTRRDGDEHRQEHAAAAAEAMVQARKELASGDWDLIIFDEINYAVKFGLIDIAEVLLLLDDRPENVHVVLTGRDARPELIEKADLVTEMKLVRHPFQKGVKAQKGIEFYEAGFYVRN